MNQNQRIEWIAPTSRAIGRMTTILFRPFEFAKWLSLGFSAWLATLFSGQTPSVGLNNIPVPGVPGTNSGGGEGTPTVPEVEEWLRTAKQYVLDNLDWILLAGGSVLFLLAVIGLAASWIRSRGKFMFLDNMVCNRALVSIPWQRFRKEGNSLFLWNCGYSCVVLLLFLALFGGAGYWGYDFYRRHPEIPDQWPAEMTPTVVLFAAGFFVAFLTLLLVTTYIGRLLEDFVVPLAYKHSLKTSEAWRIFLPIHSAKAGYFIVYYLWAFLLQLASGILAMVAIFATCCLAGILFSIPYVGAVAFLPVLGFFRMLGPEFLRQFGDRYDLWENSPDGGFSPAPPAMPMP